MATINLLDWRQQRRDLRQKQFFTVLTLGAVGSLLILLLAIAILSGAVSHQQDRNNYLRQQIADIEKQIKEIEELEKVRANLLARMKVIEELQASRAATVHFFDEIVNTLPDGVYLTALKQRGDQVSLDGVAESNGRISTYMKNLEASPWITDPKLIVIRTVDKNRRRQSEFQLQVKNLTRAKTMEASGFEPEASPGEGVVE
ncbi:MAG: PilN domain-containing protein [Longimicrobiales bacterium]